MRKKMLISIISFVVLGASAQQLNTGSANDYKHPQMAQKAKQAEAEKQAQDKSTHEYVYDQTASYKNQNNNLLKVLGIKRKDNRNAPSNTERRRNADYKHSNGLGN